MIRGHNMKNFNLKICFLIYIILCSLCIDVYAADQITSSNTKVWSDSGVKAEREFIDGKQIRFNIKANGKDNSYHSFGIYSILGLKDLRNYDGIWVTVSSNINRNLSLQFAATDKDEKKLLYKTDYKFLRRNNDESILNQAVNSFVNIDNKKINRLFIPFDSQSLQYSGIDLKKITTVGLSFVSKGKTYGDVAVSNMSFVTKSESEKYIAKFKTNITGDRNVYIPTYGEIRVPYKISGNTGFRFADNNIKGVNVTEDGMLSVNKEAKQQMLRLKAVSEDGITIEYNVNLLQSWTKTADKAHQLPPQNKYNAETSVYKVLHDRKLVNIIRASIAALSSAFFIFYCRGRVRYRKGR
ncbi:hypothetical protein [Clostridium oryzae]|uniref:Uncharacterized protein n=1 Tax=Clostridium oryzae TaxID=1450648 RepID=A0A1V4I800_9CLOT|nr:hypothetical protein [Clostridium oryzae]OPJ56112.1 hypothetical protein CLORY_43400 [Clostridium oryzae]